MARITIAEVYALVMEMGGVLWGDNKTRSNGLRSHDKAHEKRLDDLEPIANDALRKIDSHLAAHEKMNAATDQARTATRVALISSAGSVLVGIGAILAVVMK